ncbi:MAG TPA: GAF domain-containing protein, partial [Gammaproteobacteria bacterium]|nr:GAF domain-containing protein [Gammaproteobacteria bacterium]
RGVPVSATMGIGADILANCVVVPAIATGLYIMVYALSGEGLKRHVKRLFTLVFILCVALLVVLSLTRTLGIIYFAWSAWPTPLLPVISIFLGLIPFAMLVLGYTHADPEQRMRIRWILWSTGILFLALIASVSTQVASTPATRVLCEYAQALLFILATVGYTYAVLRQRLVDVRIVLNRTLVYGVITAIVVGVFAAINSVVEHATLGAGASLLLELVVPLALGIVLGSLRKYVDTYINRFLFRRQHHAEKALNDFARTCGFIEQPEHLLDLTVRQVFDHSRARSVALYEREAQGYVRVRQQGDGEFPERVEADDLAFVRLRAGDSEADLHEVASTLGPDGYLFSMAVRGKLIGALVCGPRPAEQYTADERTLLVHVAQQAGAALHALRSREHENFVDSVARGTLDAASARERARQLIAAWQAA